MANEVSGEVLLILHKEESERGAKIIRVMNWITSRGKSYIMIEKREFYKDKTGELRTGKAKGFTGKDMEMLFKRQNEYMHLLGGKIVDSAQLEDAPLAVVGGTDVDF